MQQKRRKEERQQQYTVTSRLESNCEKVDSIDVDVCWWRMNMHTFAWFRFENQKQMTHRHLAAFYTSSSLLCIERILHKFKRKMSSASNELHKRNAHCTMIKRMNTHGRCLKLKSFEKVRIVRLNKLIFNGFIFACRLPEWSSALRHDLIIVINVAKFMWKTTDRSPHGSELR